MTRPIDDDFKIGVVQRERYLTLNLLVCQITESLDDLGQFEVHCLDLCDLRFQCSHPVTVFIRKPGKLLEVTSQVLPPSGTRLSIDAYGVYIFEKIIHDIASGLVVDS